MFKDEEEHMNKAAAIDLNFLKCLSTEGSCNNKIRTTDN